MSLSSGPNSSELKNSESRVCREQQTQPTPPHPTPDTRVGDNYPRHLNLPERQTSGS
ncbi:hypothetical protein EMCG_07023 [[Emmonsia] crescens]|uniref:Uncharacterized protein n=1 Tax=[Emmonsia] crescens TaxID=73230 RepID=A0A0G2J645_9EURO|nr:hypothetical protein EMCG_07023 [Emmonsia crescens UAMH 3008]